MTNHSIRRSIITASLLFYAACLPMDSICTIDGCSGWPAWGILLFGWIEIFSSLGNFIWIANPLYFCALLYFYKNKLNRSILCCALSFAIGILFILCKYISTNESGYLSEITGTGIGYWIWISCFCTTFIAMVIYKLKVKPELQ